MSKYHDDKTAASDPLAISIADKKLKAVHPELYGWRAFLPRFKFCGKMLDGRQTRAMLGEHISRGDSRAALVMRVEPLLLVAAYTDEMDCAAVLSFPPALAAEYRLKIGSRLLTTNTYGRGGKLQSDLWEGPASCRRYTSYFPLIAEFFSDDLDAIERRKRSISEEEWLRVRQVAKEQLAKGPHMPIRDGRPLQCWKTGKAM